MITKNDFSAPDANPIILHAKRDADSTLAYPVLMDANGKLLVSVEGSGGVSTAQTSASITIASTSTLVLTANSNRIKAIMVVDGDQNVYFNYSGTAVYGEGIRINSEGGSLIEDTYIGDITAIVSSGTTNITVTEL